MPRMPKWIADKAEKIWSHYYNPVKITHTHYYNSKLKLVRMKGNFADTQFVAGQVVEFRVSDTEYRHYTPSLYDAQKGVCEILFYLHQQGAGSIWADALKINDNIKLIGPAGKMSYQNDFSRHIAFGDETSLGFMLCMQKEATKQNHAFTAMAELQAEHIGWRQYWSDCNIEVLQSSWQQPAQNYIDKLDKKEESFWQQARQSFFYLTGRTKSIQRFRKFLVSKKVPIKQIQTYPYWAEGKSGL